MSYKFTLKDVMLEAGAREYGSTPPDKSWEPSEKHKAEMEKLYKKQTPFYKRIDLSPAAKVLYAVAAVAVIAVTVLAVKPLREPVLSMFGANRLQGEVNTPKTTDTGSVLVKQNTSETTVKETETEPKETVTEADTAEEDEKSYKNDIEKYLLLHFSDPETVTRTKRMKIFKELEFDGLLDEYVVYAARRLKNEKETELLKNCAGMLIYSVAENDGGAYLYDPRSFESAKNDTEQEPGNTYYIKWYANYIEEMKKTASKLSKSTAMELNYLFYKLMNIAGFHGWQSQNTPSEAVAESLRSLFSVYNAVYGGIPMGGTSTEPVKEPYEPELAEKIKSFWGDEKREFVKSSLPLTKYKDKLKESIQTYTDLYVDDTKYFITVGEDVYLTAAKETDADADIYYFVQITKINEPDPTRTYIYGDAKVVHNGVEESFSYWFNDAYHVDYSYCNKGDFSLSEKIIIYRGEKSIEYAIDKIVPTSDMPSIAYTCCSSLKELTVGYVASHYFTETDENVKAALSALLQQCASRDKYTYNDLLGKEKADEFSRGTSVEMKSKWTEKFTEAVKDEVKNRYREEIRDFYPTIYMFLSDIDFDGYKAGEPDIALRSRKAINEAMTLANAVLCGLGRYDETSVRYSDKELGNLAFPPAVAETVKNNGIEYWEGISTQAQGFKTAEEWKRYYKKILPADVVEGAIKNTGRFIIADGIVYTSNYGGDSSYEIDILNVKKTGEKNGRTVLATDVYIPSGMSRYSQEVTFEVIDDGGDIRITGGTFIDIFLVDGITKGKAALTVYELLRAQEILYDGNMNFSDFKGYRDMTSLIHDQKEFEEFYETYDTPVPEVPEYMFPLYLYVGWSDTSSWKWTIEMILPEGYFDIMITNNKNVVPMRYAYPMITANTDTKTTPAIGSADKLTVTDIYDNITVTSVSDEKITVSLDFVREENGARKNVTYTFDMEDISRSQLYLMVTGGTFVKEVLR